MAGECELAATGHGRLALRRCARAFLSCGRCWSPHDLPGNFRDQSFYDVSPCPQDLPARSASTSHASMTRPNAESALNGDLTTVTTVQRQPHRPCQSQRDHHQRIVSRSNTTSQHGTINNGTLSQLSRSKRHCPAFRHIANRRHTEEIGLSEPDWKWSGGGLD